MTLADCMHRLKLDFEDGGDTSRDKRMQAGIFVLAGIAPSGFGRH